MRYELRLTAYDMLDQVCVSTALFQTGDIPEERPRAVLHWLSQAQGLGTSDPREWVRDALLCALEDV
jgi:hypothetical protein